MRLPEVLWQAGETVLLAEALWFVLLPVLLVEVLWHAARVSAFTRGPMTSCESQCVYQRFYGKLRQPELLAET